MGNCLTEDPPPIPQVKPDLSLGQEFVAAGICPVRFLPGVSGNLGGLIEKPAGLVEE